MLSSKGCSVAKGSTECATALIVVATSDVKISLKPPYVQIHSYMLPARQACTRRYVTIAIGLFLMEYLYRDVDVEYRDITLYYSYAPLSV